MTAELIDGGPQRALELLGVFAFATSGALVAVRKGFDAVGIMTLAWITALGGGVIRDVLVGTTPPTSFLDAWAFSLPVAAALITFFGHRVVERWMKAVLVFDAVGLVLSFAISRWGYTSLLGIGVASVIVAFRLAALGFRWRAPRAWRQTSDP